MTALRAFITRYVATKDGKMLLFLMIVSTLCTLLLGSANAAFQKASAMFDRRLYQVILEQYAVPFHGNDVETVFSERFDTQKIGNTTYYIAGDPQHQAVVFKTQGPGLWSMIELLLAVSPDFERLEWLRVLAQAETPGLGGRIAEEEFQTRFRDVDIRPAIRVVKFASGSNEVDAVTGASMTSAAVENIINSAIGEFDRAFANKDR